MNLLLTQCVQKDFLRPLADGEPLPNLVHVGRLEAERLCGRTGALVEFLQAAHRVDPARLAIVHMVDRHDPQQHAAHLAQFRPHCLAGSDGARLVDADLGEEIEVPPFAEPDPREAHRDRRDGAHERVKHRNVRHRHGDPEGAADRPLPRDLDEVEHERDRRRR